MVEVLRIGFEIALTLIFNVNDWKNRNLFDGEQEIN